MNKALASPLKNTANFNLTFLDLYKDFRKHNKMRMIQCNFQLQNSFAQIDYELEPCIGRTVREQNLKIQSPNPRKKLII